MLAYESEGALDRGPTGPGAAAGGPPPTIAVPAVSGSEAQPRTGTVQRLRPQHFGSLAAAARASRARHWKSGQCQWPAIIESES